MSADECEKDMIATLAGLALSEACGGTNKKIASAASVHPSNASRWANGERTNPIYRVLSLLEQPSTDPWPLVALFAAKAARKLLRDEGALPEWRWRQLYIEALRAEGGPDGNEDVVTVALLTGTASLKDQFAADQKVLAVTMRRVALAFIGITEGWELNQPKAH